MSDLSGKHGLIVGVANKRSIAWAIAKRLADGGARLAFTFQGERIEKNVRELAASVSSPLVTELDVRDDSAIDRVFTEVSDAFDGRLDLLVHSVAFAAAEDLEGRFTDTPRDRFWMALDVSAYSLVATSRAAEPLMQAAGGGAIVTMTYLGGERAVPHYNVMGVAKATLDSSVKYLAWDLGEKNIRVNAVSAGPVRTLAARSIAGFPTMESIVEERAPLRRHIDADDVAAGAAYLLSDDAKNVTGTTLWIAFREGNSVWKMDLETGKLERVAGTGEKGQKDGPASEATFDGPKGIVATPEGIVYVADTENNTIRSIDPRAGTVKTIAGSGPGAGGFGGDGGPALAARLNRPHGIALGISILTLEVLYIGDTENHRVRVLQRKRP